MVEQLTYQVEVVTGLKGKLVIATGAQLGHVERQSLALSAWFQAAELTLKFLMYVACPVRISCLSGSVQGVVQCGDCVTQILGVARNPGFTQNCTGFVPPACAHQGDGQIVMDDVGEIGAWGAAKFTEGGL